MAEICWFCKKNNADHAAVLEILMHKVIKKEQGVWIEGDKFVKAGPNEIRVTYLPAVIIVPRCIDCLKAHEKTKKINSICTWIGGVLILLGYLIGASVTENLQGIFLLGLGLPGIIVIIGVRIFTKNQLHKAEIEPESTKKKYPEVVKALEAGYVLGRSPVSYT